MTPKAQRKIAARLRLFLDNKNWARLAGHVDRLRFQEGWNYERIKNDFARFGIDATEFDSMMLEIDEKEARQ